MRRIGAKGLKDRGDGLRTSGLDDEMSVIRHHHKDEQEPTLVAPVPVEGLEDDLGVVLVDEEVFPAQNGSGDKGGSGYGVV